jgi:hypothetical protein
MRPEKSNDRALQLLRWIAILCLFVLAAYLQAISHLL